MRDIEFDEIVNNFIANESQDLWKNLSPNEDKEYRQWARDNYIVGTTISSLWHPAVKHECFLINKEHYKEEKQQEENPFGKQTNETLF